MKSKNKTDYDFNSIKTQKNTERNFPVKKALLVILILVVASFLVFNYSSTAAATKKYGTIEQALAESKNDALPTDRPDYLPEEVYSDLPQFPKDFYEVDLLIEAKKVLDLRTLGEEYYKQPEFYPRWEEQGVGLMQNPSNERHYLWGYGVYPADQGYAALPGDEFTATTFFHSSWLVQTYQGMKFEVVYPPATTINGFPVDQNPSLAESFFTVTFDPDTILLGPSFPRFDVNWAKKVNINVKISQDASPGTYIIGVNPVAPPKKLSDEWALQHRLRYSDAGVTGVGRPYFQLQVEVQ